MNTAPVHYELCGASQGVSCAASAASSLAGDTSPGRRSAQTLPPARNTLAEARRRLAAGWRQSVPGGWPDIPPRQDARLDQAAIRRAAADTRLVHAMRETPIHAPRPAPSRLEQWLPLVVFAVAAAGLVFAILSMGGRR